MCGICGQYDFKAQKPITPAVVKAMTKSLVHRGPDDEGYYFSGALGLGFRRLSIIDIEGGHQPMSDEQQSVWIVFNGEIYNFLELRRELEGLGHTFRTRCDTEVIIHGYKQWGVEVFNHLNGMFGLALWDVQRQRLILARDAMGIKLLYYKVDGGSVLFGSEIRAVLAALPATSLPLLVSALAGASLGAGAMAISFGYAKESVPLPLQGTVTGVVNAGVMVGTLTQMPLTLQVVVTPLAR